MKGIYTTRQALDRAMKLCSKREYAHKDIRQKVHSWGFGEEETEEVIALLIEQNFLNEGRFSEAAVKDKFKMNSWGRIKIRHWLRQKGVSDFSIDHAMREIDEKEYDATLQKLIDQKWKKTSGNRFEKGAATKQYALRRGYEPQLVNGKVSELMGA